MSGDDAQATDPVGGVEGVPPGMLVGVLGGGGFGRGIALQASRQGNTVRLWSRRPGGIDLPGVEATDDLSRVAEADLLFLAVPSTVTVPVAEQLARVLDGRHRVVHVSRGLVGGELQTVSHVLRQRTAARRLGALAGPLSATSLAEGNLGGGVVGSHFPEVPEAARRALGSGSLRLYATDDLVGVEFASAMVGLLAVATGYALELGFGPNAISVLVTRGMAEAARLGQAVGAREATFRGLAGMGDFLSVVAGDPRPEVELGRALARGMRIDDALATGEANIEGVRIARQVVSFAARVAVPVPMTEVVSLVISGELSGDDAVQRLLARPVDEE